jgi:hypothetical protein
MRSVIHILAAALVSGVSGTAMAQTTPQPTPAPAVASPSNVGLTRSHWTTAGFVGSNFAVRDAAPGADNASVTFGGQLAYLWKGVVGAEFLADFAPSFNGVTNLDILNPNNPRVATYMGNAIGALPLGADGHYQPYISGGYGGIRLAPRGVLNVLNSQTSGGGNLGGGIMAFGGRFGIRADARYYRASTDNNLDLIPSLDQLTSRALSGLGFWRTNAGVAFQW